MATSAPTLSALRIPEELVYAIVAAHADSLASGEAEVVNVPLTWLPPGWPHALGKRKHVRLQVHSDLRKARGRPDGQAHGLYWGPGHRGNIWIKPALSLKERVSVARHEAGHFLQALARKAGIHAGYTAGEKRSDGKRASGAPKEKHSLRPEEFKPNLDSDAAYVVAHVTAKLPLSPHKLRETVRAEVTRIVLRRFGSLQSKKARSHASELYSLVESGLRARSAVRLNPSPQLGGKRRNVVFNNAVQDLEDAANMVGGIREDFLFAIAQRNRLRARLREGKQALADAQEAAAHAQAENNKLWARLRKAEDSAHTYRRRAGTEAANRKQWEKFGQEQGARLEMTKRRLAACQQEVEEVRAQLAQAREAVAAGGVDKKKLRRQQERELRKQAKKQRRR